MTGPRFPSARWTLERSRWDYRLIVDLRSLRLAVEAVKHAAAAGDQQLVADSRSSTTSVD
jgi:hypothetical protein